MVPRRPCRAAPPAPTPVEGVDGDSANVVGRESGHPDAHETFVQVEKLQLPLCGGSRPHFFRGVATVGAERRPRAQPAACVCGKFQEG